MNNKYFLPIVLFLSFFVLFIIIFIVMVYKRKQKFKHTIEELDYEKNKIIGVPILSELSKVRDLVKTDDLKFKLADWDREFDEIKNNKIDVLTDLITDADFLIDRREYKEALKKIADIEIMLDELKRKTDNLLEQVRVITNSEERNRAIVTKLKVIYRELDEKFQRTKKDYGVISDDIGKELERLDDMFLKFERYMDKNDYVSVEKLVVILDEDINKLKLFMDTVPSLMLMATMMIPNKIEETKTYYFRMQRDGYPLDYLNIEYNIKEIREKIMKIIDDLHQFEVGNSEVELKTMLDYFNTVFNSFDKEKEAKDTFRENIRKLKAKLEEVNKIVYDIYLQMDDIKSTYDLNDTDIGKFSEINKTLEQINEDYKILYEHGKGRTFAYSKLVIELDGLNNRLTRLQDDLDYQLKSITSMKDDEVRAREQLNMIENLLRQAKAKLKDVKIPVIPNSYFIELREAGDAIREIIKELDKKPIVIKILNIRVDTARDLVFKIYNKTNDIVRSVNLCEDLIVYGNRYRDVDDEINKALNMATDMFRKGKYRQSMETSLGAISVLDETVYDRFEIKAK